MYKILIISIFCVCIGYTMAQEDIICPPGLDFWPHWNCSLFYNCSTDGNHLVYECPVGLYFNPSFGGCDFPFAVSECVEGTRAPPGSTTTPISEPSTTATWTTPPITGSTSPHTTPSNDICPEGSVFWPHSNCSQFYICVACGSPFVHSCAAGYFYSTTLGTCDLEENVVDCVDGTRPTTTPSPVQCPPDGTHKVPHPTHGDAFFLCVDGILDPDYYYFVCSDCLHFDALSER
ncbi:peritrophin-1 [Folsomia candida]|uniref:Putative chitinase 3 n=1 Tax=Folsomia candida TaxID=158441 RepID=A0A226DND5_FOLCA|nr:peritrophin-1 [Folsomia candida]OXA47052.1 putative chitinase 3 [Folsomia candida]